MAISVLKISAPFRWDEAVKELPDYDVFYLSGYMKAFQLQGSGEPLLVIYTNGDDYAINAVFRRDVADDRHFVGKLEKGRYYDLSSPYGYGGFIGNVSDWDALEIEWNQYCREQGYICEFVRFGLFSEYWKNFSGEVVSVTHNVVRDLEMPLDEMWMDFKQKVRKNVKRALQYNLEILADPDGKYLEEFLKIYDHTMDRNDAKEEYYFSNRFFDIINTMKDNHIYFHVLHDGKIISTELVLYGTENCYSYLGGTYREYYDMRPNDFLKYEIIKWAKEKKLKRFVLGGGYGSDDGIFEYKKNLAPNGIVDFWVGKKIFDKGKYEELCKMRGEDIALTGFFPAYRER